MILPKQRTILDREKLALLANMWPFVSELLQSFKKTMKKILKVFTGRLFRITFLNGGLDAYKFTIN
jgi:hypothetical protein